MRGEGGVGVRGGGVGCYPGPAVDRLSILCKAACFLEAYVLARANPRFQDGGILETLLNVVH